jgi:hypothetical protein
VSNEVKHEATCPRCGDVYGAAEPFANVFCPSCPKGGMRGVLTSDPVEQSELAEVKAQLSALQARCDGLERDAARYRVRRREVARILGEDPSLYDEETDALAELQREDGVALATPAGGKDGGA